MGRVQVLQWSDYVVEAAPGVDPFTGPVFVMEAGEDDEDFVVRHETLATAFQAEASLMLGADTVIVLLGPLADLATGDWPFPDGLVLADAESWAWTSWDEAKGCGDWMVSVNGDDVAIDLGAFPFGSYGPAGEDLAGVGDVLSIDVADYDGVGCAFSLDRWGGGWVRVWTLSTTFLGPSECGDPVAIIEACVEGRTFGEASISTELLSDTQMRAAVDQLAKTDLVELTDDTDLHLRGGAITVGEFLRE